MLIIKMSTNNHNGGLYMKTIIKNEHAQAGVGTLIIFIAMVLVAAVAAAVLIQTSGVMQAKSTSTTKEAAAAIGENIVVEAVDGVASGPTLQYLNITIKVAAGGSDLDLSKLLVKVQTTNFNYTSAASLSANRFRVYALRQEGTSLANATYTFSDLTSPTLQAGALARLDMDISGSGLNLQQKKPMTLSLTPEKGATYNLPVTLPGFSGTTVAIYP